MNLKSAQEIWETALGELEVQVSKANFRTWLEKTKGLKYEGNEFTIGVPNTFVAEYLERNQSSLIRKTLIGITRQDIEVIFTVASGAAESHRRPAAVAVPRLNPKYTFDSFVVTECNRLAHQAALAVVEKPGRVYNPLFICGGCGLGKTHLLNAIGLGAAARHMNVLYVSGEQFTNEFISALKERHIEDFRRQYRSADMLLIDDVQFIGGKEQTEECLFNTFNELHNANRQIALTCDRPPQSITGLSERLRSRFQWGLVADIEPPDFGTRFAILQSKVKQMEADVAPDVLEVIAQRLQQNIRELEGNLNRVLAYAHLLRAVPTPEMASRALDNISGRTPRLAAPDLALITERVAASFRVSPAALKGERREKEIVQARQVAMYLMKQQTDASLAQIGSELGGRNASTVKHACEKIAAALEASPYLQRKLAELEQKLKQG